MVYLVSFFLSSKCFLKIFFPLDVRDMPTNLLKPMGERLGRNLDFGEVIDRKLMRFVGHELGAFNQDCEIITLSKMYL